MFHSNLSDKQRLWLMIFFFFVKLVTVFSGWLTTSIQSTWGQNCVNSKVFSFLRILHPYHTPKTLPQHFGFQILHVAFRAGCYQSVCEPVHPWAAAPEEAEMLRGFVSVWGGGLCWNVWQRLPIDTCIQFIIYAVIRCRREKTVNGDYSFIKPSFLQFSVALFLSLHTSLLSAMKSLFWLASFCLITFNERRMIYHSNRSCSMSQMDVLVWYRPLEASHVNCTAQ